MGLRVSDVDLKAGQLTIGRNRVVEVAGKTEEREGDRESVRTMDLPLDLLTALRDHLAESTTWRTSKHDPLFLTSRAHVRPLRPNFNIHVWKPALIAAGLDPKVVSFHSLRHSAAVRMIREGRTAEEVARCLGHRQVLTTKKTYKRFFAEMEENDLRFQPLEKDQTGRTPLLAPVQSTRKR